MRQKKDIQADKGIGKDIFDDREKDIETEII